MADTHTHQFTHRHIGLNPSEQAKMLEALGYPSASDLLTTAVPDSIQLDKPLDVAGPLTEHQALGAIRAIANKNKVLTSLIGTGWNDCITPPVIRRNMIENPAWYTSYTPYQPEISQGRLEMLLTFQTMVADLTGCEIANASLLDEATAAAEAMTMLRRIGRSKNTGIYVDENCHPQTIVVVKTRAKPLGIDVIVGPASEAGGAGMGDRIFGALLAYPGSTGEIVDIKPIIDAVHEAGALVAVTADLLACTVLTPPGEMGADIVVGSAQRFGVPMGFGGPNAGYMACADKHVRTMPGRLVGVSVDADGRPAYRLTLQTREQHIRREKATSNICTAQALLANVAAAYGAWHGPEGLTEVANEVHRLAARFAAGAQALGLSTSDSFFDTVRVSAPGQADAIMTAAVEAGINLRPIDGDSVAANFDETSTDALVDTLIGVIAGVVGGDAAAATNAGTTAALPSNLARTSEFMTHPNFSMYRTETEMMRWLRRLSDRDLALDRTMIPLGSCTMKLNAAAEMEPITWPEFAGIHPYAPADQTVGYREMIADLEQALCEVTGYDRVSLQPNAGSQGEFAGLLAIKAWHDANGDHDRDICLIPASAHGTNAASAVLAGMRVVVVATTDDGNVDLQDLESKIGEHGDKLAALMITYPSTHGVYEHTVGEVCAMVHDAGGQVYTDGANLNALLGVAKPGKFGSDVSHLNLHKTFCIPHGGGGPGVGPVGVREHLAPYLPSHPVVPIENTGTVGAVSSAPWGSAGILPISWMYLQMMGPAGLREATEAAVLSANYIAHRLNEHYPVLYTGENGLVAHECIIDLRGISHDTGVSNDDVAKRLADYGFHAPTMSFPVAGTLMIEPTESESLAELDRFCDAMIAIKGEIDDVAAGKMEADSSILRNAPHTVEELMADEWNRPYSRKRAAFPLPGMTMDKYFCPVNRIDNVYGDRNIACSCPPLDAYQEMATTG